MDVLAWRSDERVLDERALDDGQSAVLGDRQPGALYIMAPNSMMAILLGMALGGMFTTTVRARAREHRPHHRTWVVDRGRAVAGALYLFCGAVFPLDALPA